MYDIVIVMFRSACKVFEDSLHVWSPIAAQDE